MQGLLSLRDIQSVGWLAQAFEQGRGIPSQGGFKLMGPRALAVVFEFRFVGTGTARVLYTVLGSVRVLRYVVMVTFQWQYFFAGVLIQPERIGFGVYPKLQRNLVRFKVWVPEFLLTVGHGDRLEPVDTG